MIQDVYQRNSAMSLLRSANYDKEEIVLRVVYINQFDGVGLADKSWYPHCVSTKY